jgi:hypothetical protein
MFSNGRSYYFVGFYLVFAMCLFCNLGSCFASGEIEITNVPAYGTYGNLSGIVSGVNPADYKVLVYIYVSGWWNKPTWASPETSIASDGSWQCNVTGGTSDTHATEFMAVLVPNGSYQASWEMHDSSNLPSDLLSHPFVNTYRTPETINFANHNWSVKAGFNGPGPNNFSDDAGNVWVDGDGFLHLKIISQGGQWYCSEIVSDESFGYGTYVFTVDSRVDTLDRNITFGLFTWDTYAPQYNYREIDFEFGRWGDPAKDIAQYVIQPWNGVGNMHRFDIDYDGTADTTTHVMTWRADGIYFKSYYGDFSLAPPPENIIRDWFYTGPDNPPAGGENVRMNLWLINGFPPSDGLESEVIVKDFQFLTGISDQPGDVSYDGDVNLADLASIALNWQAMGCDIGNTWCGRTDLNCDGSVGIEDLSAIAYYWLDSLY